MVPTVQVNVVLNHAARFILPSILIFYDVIMRTIRTALELYLFCKILMKTWNFVIRTLLRYGRSKMIREFFVEDCFAVGERFGFGLPTAVGRFLNAHRIQSVADNIYFGAIVISDCICKNVKPQSCACVVSE